MNFSRPIVVGLALAMAVCQAETSRAELPPEAYEELLKNAQEVVDVRITRVRQVAAPDGEMLKYVCDATVLGVERSKADIAPGESIQFESYAISPAARRRGFVGPAPPPRLAPGQTWRVSLNAGDEAGGPYQLAAYGRSFQPIQAPAPPGASPHRLGVTAAPVAGGGMRISSVVPRSIADKLGLRPGDRVLEINGDAIDAATDVAPAIEKNDGQVEVKFLRAGETIELVLKLPGKPAARDD